MNSMKKRKKMSAYLLDNFFCQFVLFNHNILIQIILDIVSFILSSSIRLFFSDLYSIQKYKKCSLNLTFGWEYMCKTSLTVFWF